MLTKTKELFARIHADDTGAMAVEKILLIALIAIPLILVLAAFRTQITTWFTNKSGELGKDTSVTGG